MRSHPQAPLASRRRTARIAFRWMLRTLGALVMGVVLAWWVVPFPAGLLTPPPQATVLLDRHGEPLRVFLAPSSIHTVWVPYADLGDWLPRALVAAEDQRFWQHSGIDFLALARAIRQNVVHARRVSGASTLSTQVIRMASPRPRTLPTKCREFFLATQMERRLSKTTILEQYLNRAPFGANLFGAEAAAQRYFGKRARDLSLPEAALLAGLPQSPTRHRPDVNPGRATRRRSYVLGRMLATGVITSEQRAAAESAPLPASLVPHPFVAPHFCQEVARRAGDRLSGGFVRTTLDADVQRMAEAALTLRLAALPDVRGGAIVVLDTETAEVRAMVGSHDASDTRHAGQFNHTLGWRSPGSALKPFAYALALDQGRINPATALADVPRHFTAYQPANFDGTFRGVVSARDALVQSLNIPALDLVRDCTPELFHEQLLAFGTASRLPRTAARLGSGAVLGNTEVRLLDLTSAYATLGRAGHGRSACLTAAPPSSTPVTGPSVVSPEAAWIVLDMLSGDERAQVETGHYADVSRTRVAWKTGTSSGFRDAWTFAVTPSYTLGVWLGNPDGRPAQSLVGVEAAAPLAFALMGRLAPLPDAPAWFERPAGIVDLTVCATSGARPSEDCPRQTVTTAIAGVTRPDRCTVHRRVLAADGTSSVEEVWPEEIEAVLRRAPSAPSISALPPRVATPAPNEVFRRQDGSLPGTGSLPLRAAGAAPLHWFVDGLYLGTTADSAPLLWSLTVGHHTVLCCDAQGRATSVRFTVE